MLGNRPRPPQEQATRLHDKGFWGQAKAFATSWSLLKAAFKVHVIGNRCLLLMTWSRYSRYREQRKYGASGSAAQGKSVTLNMNMEELPPMSPSMGSSGTMSMGLAGTPGRGCEQEIEFKTGRGRGPLFAQMPRAGMRGHTKQHSATSWRAALTYASC